MEEEFNRIRQIIEDSADFNYFGKPDLEMVKKLVAEIEILVNEKYDNQISKISLIATVDIY